MYQRTASLHLVSKLHGIRGVESPVLGLGSDLDDLLLAGGHTAADDEQEAGGAGHETNIDEAPVTVRSPSCHQSPGEEVLHPGWLTETLPGGLVTLAVATTGVLTDHGLHGEDGDS